MADSITILSLKAEGGEKTSLAIRAVNTELKNIDKTATAMKKKGGIGAALSASERDNVVTFAEKAALGLEKAGKYLAELQKAQTEALTRKEWVDYQSRIERAAKAYETLQTAAEGAARATDRVKYARKIGSYDTATTTVTSGALGGLSSAISSLAPSLGDAADEAASMVESLKSIIDTADTMKDAIGPVTEGLSRAADIAGVAKTAFVLAGGGIGGMAAAAKVLFISLGPIAVAATAAAAAIAFVSNALQAEADAAKEREEGNIARLDMFAEFDRLIAEGASDEDIQAWRDNAETHRQGLQNEIDTYGQISDAFQAASETVNPNLIEDLGARLERGIRGLTNYNDVIDEVTLAYGSQEEAQQALLDISHGTITSFDGIAGRLEDHTKQMEQYADAVAYADGEIADGALAQARAARAAENLKDAEEGLIDVRNEAFAAQEAFTQSLIDFARQNTREDAQTTESRRRDDELSLRAHSRDLVRINTEGYARIREAADSYLESVAKAFDEFRKDEVKADADYAKQQLRADKELQKAITEAEQNYMESEIEANETYAKEIAKADKENAKERLRRLKDLNATLQEAELNNDIVGFINAQRAFEKEERDAAEQTKDQADERQAAYLEERVARREALQEQIADLRENAKTARDEALAQFNEDRAERAAQFQERQAEQAAEHILNMIALKAQMADERQAAIDAFALQAADTKEARDYENEQRKAARAQTLSDMIAAHEEQLVALKKRETQYTEIINSQGAISVASFKRNFMEPIQSLIESAGNMVRSQMASFASYGYGSTYGKSIGMTSSYGSSSKTSISFGNVNLAGVSQAAFTTQMTSLQKSITSAVSFARYGVRVPTY